MMHVSNITFRISFFLVMLLISLHGACSSPELMHYDFFEDDSGTTLQWPPHPQKPRILHIGLIQEPHAADTRGSWLERFIGNVFGSERNMTIMLRPYGVYADIDRIYVTDPGSGRLHVYDRSNKKYFTVESADDVDLISPVGIAADANGDMYVSDSVLKQVFVFDKEGNFLRSIAQPDMFQRPAGIALGDDRIYVVDTHHHKILVLSKTDGRLLFSFGQRGTEHGNFNYPTNIFAGRDKFIYVMDSLNFRVQIFDRDGKFISSFGKLGDGSGNFSKPKGIAVDSEGHIYVVDAHFDNVQIFDAQGNLLLVFGGPGNGKGEFTLPAGIHIDSSDRIYVVDSYNKRIQVFQYVKEANAIHKNDQ